MESKDSELRNLYINTEKNSKLSAIQDTKIQKEMLAIKRQLSVERNLKLDAFHKLDELQTQVFDLEDELTNIVQIRPQTSKDGNKSKLNYYKRQIVHLIFILSKDLRSTASSKNQARFTSPFPRISNLPGNNNITNSIINATATTATTDIILKSQRPKTVSV